MIFFFFSYRFWSIYVKRVTIVVLVLKWALLLESGGILFDEDPAHKESIIYLIYQMLDLPLCINVYLFSLSENSFAVYQQHFSPDLETLSSPPESMPPRFGKSTRDNQCYSTCCFYCRKPSLQRNTTLMQCNRCKRVMYCSVECSFKCYFSIVKGCQLKSYPLYLSENSEACCLNIVVTFLFHILHPECLY